MINPICVLCFFFFVYEAPEQLANVLRDEASIEVNLFDDATFTALNDRIAWRSPTRFTWFGGIAEPVQGRFVLVVEEGRVEGLITIGTRRFRIRPAPAGLHLIFEVNPDTFPDEGVDYVVLPDSARQGPPPGDTPSPDANQAVGIDVLIVYTPAARDAILNNSGSINAFMQLLIDVTNDAYVNSALANVSLNLVAALEVNYTEAASMSTDLSRLRTNGDGYMDDVHLLREQSGADLVALITVPSDYCGIAYLSNPSPQTSGSGFSVTGWTCGGRTFAHELGHNMGLWHDPYVSPQLTPFEFGHGYVDTVNGFLTIMSYYNKCSDAGVSCTRIPHFWDDLDPSSGGTVHYYDDAANDRFIVQYTGVPRFSLGGPIHSR